MYDLDNYRSITLTTNVYKIYSKVLEEDVMTYLEDNNASRFRTSDHLDHLIFN
jgi:hypothetical protein